jgi:hypothetical protein
MRRILIALATALATASFAVPAALGDSPHFLKASASINGSGALVCSFKEAGLGTISATNVTCSADASAVYACINGGGNHPKAANKETVSGPLTGGGPFPVRNGQTTGDITLGPLGPGDFSCPSGQNLVLASVSYSNITLSGEAGDVNLGSLSATFVNI